MRFFFLLPALLAVFLAACAPTGQDDPTPGITDDTAPAERYVDADCQIGGCSGEICGEAGGEPIASNCIYKPSFACYGSARCEKQADGLCDWTMTAELSACLMDPPTA